MPDVPAAPKFTVEEFLDWTPPAGFEKRRWHLMNGEPVLMPAFDIEQATLLSEASYVLNAHLRHNETEARVGTMVAVRSGASERNLYVAGLGVTRARAAGARLMQNPELLVEIEGPDNWQLVRVGVFMMQRAPSVEEILVLDSRAVRAWLHRRNNSGEWDDPLEIGAEDRLHLRSLGIGVPLSRFYHSTDTRPPEQRRASEASAASPAEVAPPSAPERPTLAGTCNEAAYQKIAAGIRTLQNRLGGVKLVVDVVNQALDRVDDGVYQFEMGLAKLEATMREGFDRLDAKLDLLLQARNLDTRAG